MTKSTVEFVAGRVYQMTSVCDSNCNWYYQVERRTAKSVWVVEVDINKAGAPTVGEAKRFGIKVYNGEEQVTPKGRYSMNPILGAGRVVSEDRYNLTCELLADESDEAEVKETPAEFIIQAMSELSLAQLGQMIASDSEPQTIKFVAAAINLKVNG